MDRQGGGGESADDLSPRGQLWISRVLCDALGRTLDRIESSIGVFEDMVLVLYRRKRCGAKKALVLDMACRSHDDLEMLLGQEARFDAVPGDWPGVQLLK